MEFGATGFGLRVETALAAVMSELLGRPVACRWVVTHWMANGSARTIRHRIACVMIRGRMITWGVPGGVLGGAILRLARDGKRETSRAAIVLLSRCAADPSGKAAAIHPARTSVATSLES